MQVTQNRSFDYIYQTFLQGFLQQVSPLLFLVLRIVMHQFGCLDELPALNFISENDSCLLHFFMIGQFVMSSVKWSDLPNKNNFLSFFYNTNPFQTSLLEISSFLLSFGVSLSVSFGVNRLKVSHFTQIIIFCIMRQENEWKMEYGK